MTRQAKSARAIRELDGLKGRNSHSRLCIFLAELCDLVAMLAATSTTGGRGWGDEKLAWCQFIVHPGFGAHFGLP